MASPLDHDPFAAPASDVVTSEPGKPPWMPRSIGWISFFFSFLAGGILLALNYERLGQPEKKATTLTVTILAFVGFMTLVWFLPEDSIFDRVSSWVNVAIAFGIARVQKEEYEAHVAAGGATASIWPVVGMCFAIALVVGGGLIGLFLLLDEPLGG